LLKRRRSNVTQILPGALTGAPATAVATPAADQTTQSEKLVRALVPRIDALIQDAYDQGPDLAWHLYLNPGDVEAKTKLDNIKGTVKTWQGVRAAILTDPALPATVVAAFPAPDNVVLVG
jgi:hypothetical protein